MTNNRATRLLFQFSLWLCFVLTMSGWVLTRSEAEEFAPTDFISLFNGKDFTGWRFGDESAAPKQLPATWRVVNGVIVGQGNPAAMLASQWD
ncbi:MAG: hypothetical protein ACKOBW_00515, partial [Planctomycetota bacterium]